MSSLQVGSYDKTKISDIFFVLGDIVNPKRDLRRRPIRVFELSRLASMILILGQYILLSQNKGGMEKALADGISREAIEQYPRLDIFFRAEKIPVVEIHWKLCVLFKEHRLSMKSRKQLSALSDKMYIEFLTEEEKQELGLVSGFHKT